MLNASVGEETTATRRGLVIDMFASSYDRRLGGRTIAGKLARRSVFGRGPTEPPGYRSPSFHLTNK